MARRRTSAVGLQLRFSENLRHRIEQAAKKVDRSMNAEIIHRLMDSFGQAQNARLLEALLGSGPTSLHLIRSVATALSLAGPNWSADAELARNVGDAIRKIIAVVVLATWNRTNQTFRSARSAARPITSLG
jgi:hypothetical protein